MRRVRIYGYNIQESRFYVELLMSNFNVLPSDAALLILVHLENTGGRNSAPSLQGNITTCEIRSIGILISVWKDDMRRLAPTISSK